ncbi:MAG TPA: hypothetical protein VFZ65_23845 [Planctomycetota bacterium]|nr:hypothetical protein [Planctomycetota bacterium]
MQILRPRRMAEQQADGRQPHRHQHAPDRFRIVDRRQQPPLPAAPSTQQNVDQEHPPQQLRPRVTPFAPSPLTGPMRHHALPQQLAAPRVSRIILEDSFVVGRFRRCMRTGTVFPFLDTRYDPRPDPCRRRQHAVVRHQMPARSRHQRAQSLDQHVRLEHDVRRAVFPPLLQLVAHPPIRQQRQA